MHHQNVIIPYPRENECATYAVVNMVLDSISAKCDLHTRLLRTLVISSVKRQSF